MENADSLWNTDQKKKDGPLQTLLLALDRLFMW